MVSVPDDQEHHNAGATPYMDKYSNQKINIFFHMLATMSLHLETEIHE